MSLSSSSPAASFPHDSFATTRWSIVLAAGKDRSPDSQQALVILCNTYWQPLYAYVRRRGYRAEESQDLVQDFFARLLEKESVAAADPDRGKFRSFLLASLNHFLANEWRRNQAQKRGGAHAILTFDFQRGETSLTMEPADDVTPEKVYERKWALTLLATALEKLRSEYAAANKSLLFDRLQPYLGGRAEGASYSEVARELEMTEGAIKVAVHRLRRRCRDILRAEIAQTVAGPEEVDQELRDLFAALGS